MAEATMTIGPEAPNEKWVMEWIDGLGDRLDDQGSVEMLLSKLREALAGHRQVEFRWVVFCDPTSGPVKALVLMTDPEPV